MSMLDDDLDVFIAVCETHSFSKAAQKLSLTQSAVTKKIKKLEDRLGADLFDRSKRPIALTQEAEVLMHQALLARESLEKTGGESREGAFLLIKGKKAPIIGRICMDSLTADVTDIEGVESGMAVTLIGREGTEEIKCEDVARKCGTIPNEILSRLGERLERVYIQGKNVS